MMSVALVIALLCTVTRKSVANNIHDFTNSFVKSMNEKSLTSMFDFDEFGDVETLANAFEAATKDGLQILELDPGTAPTDIHDAVVNGTEIYGSSIPKEKWVEMYGHASANVLEYKGILDKDNVNDLVWKYVEAFDDMYVPDSSTVKSNIDDIIFTYYATPHLTKAFENTEDLNFATGVLVVELIDI